MSRASPLSRFVSAPLRSGGTVPRALGRSWPGGRPGLTPAAPAVADVPFFAPPPDGVPQEPVAPVRAEPSKRPPVNQEGARTSRRMEEPVVARPEARPPEQEPAPLARWTAWMRPPVAAEVERRPARRASPGTGAGARVPSPPRAGVVGTTAGATPSRRTETLELPGRTERRGPMEQGTPGQAVSPRSEPTRRVGQEAWDEPQPVARRVPSLARPPLTPARAVDVGSRRSSRPTVAERLNPPLRPEPSRVQATRGAVRDVRSPDGRSREAPEARVSRPGGGETSERRAPPPVLARSGDVPVERLAPRPSGGERSTPPLVSAPPSARPELGAEPRSPRQQGSEGPVQVARPPPTASPVKPVAAREDVPRREPAQAIPELPPESARLPSAPDPEGARPPPLPPGRAESLMPRPPEDARWPASSPPSRVEAAPPPAPRISISIGRVEIRSRAPAPAPRAAPASPPREHQIDPGLGFGGLGRGGE
jgi:hypothetical protein